MSSNSNRILRILEDVELTVRRTTRFRRGVELSSEQALLVNDAYVLTFAAWFDLLSSNGQPVGPLDRWINSICRMDLNDVVGILKAADCLLLSEPLRRVCNYECFKRTLRDTWHDTGLVIAPLKGLLDAWYDEFSYVQFSALHNAFVFLTRLNLPGLDDLEAEALENYYADEARLSSMNYDGEESSLEAQVLQKWFPGDTRGPVYKAIYGEWIPKHGQGSVADTGSSLNEKYHSMGTDELLQFCDNRLPEGSTVLPRPRCSFERVSKLVFVPKSIDKLRTISMEPAVLQWYQQGFGRNIVKVIHDNRSLRRRINLYHQEYNRDLAMDGSIGGEFATIDLSSASDSVSYRLVKKLFSHTCLIRALMVTRSSRTALPDGSVIKIDKFAPMGSNLCFPVESLVFASIVEASILRCGDSVRSSQYRVYGDDLVVETKYAPYVIERLNSLGFRVNESKSFLSQQDPIFRESCGGEFLDGADVTPVRLSRKFSGLDVSRRHPSRIAAMIDLCNESYYSLPSVRRWTIRKISRLPIGYRVRFDDSGDTGIFSVTPTNFTLGPRKWHHDYQVHYWSCGHVKTRKGDPCPETDEDIRLYEYLRLTRDRKSLVFPEDAVNADISSSKGLSWARINTLAPDSSFHAEPNAWELSLEKGYD